MSAPGNVGVRTAFGPRIYIPARDLPATRLLGFGARAEYEAFVRLPAGRLAAGARRALPSGLLRPERVRVRTVAEDQREPERRARPAHRLPRAGGADRAAARRASAWRARVVVFIRQRLDTIAVLRCLGASAGRVLAHLRRSRRRRWGSPAASLGAAARACWRSGSCRASWPDCCRSTSEPVVSPRAPWRSASGWGSGSRSSSR